MRTDTKEQSDNLERLVGDFIMKYKIGETLFSCHIDEDTGRASYSEWIVRTKRRGKFYAVLKTEFTWVKLRWGKDKTRGWAKSIPDFCRDSCKVGEKFWGKFRTKKQALAHAKECKRARERRLSNVTGDSRGRI